jgi:hypothetical protein
MMPNRAMDDKENQAHRAVRDQGPRALEKETEKARPPNTKVRELENAYEEKKGLESLGCLDNIY